jgi:DNA primase
MLNGFVSFAEVKRAITMEAVLARYNLSEALTQKGKNLAGPCPFCKGKSARQFQVNLVKSAWYCFGCKQGGNVLDFVAKREGVSVRAAAVKLDSWFELGLLEEAPRGETPATQTEKPRLAREAPRAGSPPAPVEAASVTKEPVPAENPPLTFTLKTLDPHHESLAPLRLGAATIKHFGAGYCAKGLLKGRLAIPIHNSGGELVAYAGLALAEDASPRYLFPPKFHPELEVMNLNRIPEFAGGDGRLYVVPEIERVLRLAEVQIVAVLGLFDGSLSEEQEKAVRGALPLFERLILVGKGFPERTVARLARHAPVTWVSDLPEEFLAEETQDVGDEAWP